MSDVNFLAYAQAIGSQNPVADGLNQIGATLDAQREQRMRDHQMAQQQQAANVAGKINAIKLSDLQREHQVEEGARTALAAPQPSAVFVPKTPVNSLAAMVPPGVAALAKPEFAASAEKQPASVFNTEGKMEQPSVATNSDRVLLDYYAKNDRAKYDGMQKVMLEKFKALSEVDPAAAVKWYGEVSGQKMDYVGKKGDYSVINAPDGSVIAVNTKNPADIKVIQKGDKVQTFAPGVGVMGKDGKVTIPVPKEEKPEYKFRERTDGNRTVAEESQDNGKTWKKVSEGPRYKPAAATGGGTGHGGLNVKMNGLSPTQSAALTAAIGEGRLDPYKINSKNQQVLADAAVGNPGINLNDMAANLGLARNKDVQMKGAIAETVPPLLKSIVENGKKLNYSNNQFVGQVQQWVDKKSNNPQFVKYMSLRNDQLLTLGGIMRSNGMTDMAQKLEEEAAQPTMSPRALEGWLEGQMESVDPRLKMYRSIREGKGAPRPAGTSPTKPRTASDYLNNFNKK
jgi:hypothetical protein